MFLARLLLFIFLWNISVFSQEIVLRKSFWLGYQYTTDNTHFKTVGYNSGGLDKIIKKVPGAHLAIQQYKKNTSLAWLSGVPGGTMVGWSLGGYLGGGKWLKNFSVLSAVGIPLIIVSLYFNNEAENNLLEAVTVFNSAINPINGQKNFNHNDQGNGLLYFQLKF